MIYILKLFDGYHEPDYFLKTGKNVYRRNERKIMNYLCSPHKSQISLREYELEDLLDNDNEKVIDAYYKLCEIKNNTSEEKAIDSFFYIWNDEDIKIIV